MDTKKDVIPEDKRVSILFHAEKLLYYNNLLIQQCDSWLSEEEGNRKMEKKIEERRKKDRELTMINTIGKITEINRK